jgi:hypothetical protein
MVAAAATTTTATAAATTTTTTAASATTTTTAAAGALFRFVDAERAPVEVSAVHGRHGAFRLGARAHGHEAEAARLARHAVRYQVDINHFAAGGESLAERVLG